MKHHLINTSFYGIGAGICIFVSIQNQIARNDFGFCSLFLVILILIMFVIKEILSRTNSESPDSKSQTWDKILLFMFLAVSGVGLPSIWVVIDSFFIHPPQPGDMGIIGVVYIIVPIAIVYSIVASGVLLRLFVRRNMPNVTIVSTAESTIATNKEKNDEAYAQFLKEKSGRK